MFRVMMVNTRKIDIGRQESSPSRNIVLFSLMMYVDCRKERKKSRNLENIIIHIFVGFGTRKRGISVRHSKMSQHHYGQCQRWRSV